MRICKRTCIYQTNGICTINCTDAIGQPAIGGACLHGSFRDVKRLESPHRYCAPELIPTPWGFEVPQHDMLE